MDRGHFNFITGDLPKDGVKRACYVVREYLRCEECGCLNACAVSKEEYNKALGIILAFSYQNSNNETVVEQWRCDDDCCLNNGYFGFCSGEFQIGDNDGMKLCKYFADSSYK